MTLIVIEYAQKYRANIKYLVDTHQSLSNTKNRTVTSEASSILAVVDMLDVVQLIDVK